jgi:CRISPR-associated protein Cas1
MSAAGVTTHDENEAQPLLPVRRLHNFVYCPRLCYLQWVENLFVENADTAAGSAAHRNVDKATSFNDEKKESLAKDLPEGASLRSLHLTSESLRLTGIVDLVEGGEAGACVVDYKRGSALRDANGERIAKEYDAIQVAAHALLLEESGTPVESGSIYYAADKRHVQVELTPELFATTRSAIEQARSVGLDGHMPPPLNNDVRCNYCSAYPICLPKESAWWAAQKVFEKQQSKQLGLLFDESIESDLEEAFEEQEEEMMPPRPERNDGEILVVQTPGTQVGQRGGEIVVSQKRQVLRKLPLQQVRSIYVYGAVQLTAQAAQTCLEENIDVAYFSPAGRFLGALQGLPTSGVDARIGQYDLFKKDFCRIKLAGECIRAKIRNQRVMLMRNGSPDKKLLKRLSRAAENATKATSLDEIRGIEGGAAAVYFGEFGSMLKVDGKMSFDFTKRTRRPPRDPVNALLSLGYSILAKELAGICHQVGLDPFLGFFHQPRYGRPALALDLMEEFRPLIADSVAVSLINRGEIDESDFYFSARGVILNARGRRRFWEAWFRRLDTEVSHPEFKYRMSYRRMMEVQARQLWRFVRGEAPRYYGFKTR